MALEALLLQIGVTLVFMDRVVKPHGHGYRNIGDLICGLVDYDKAGKERRDLAEKMLYTQLTLARAGFSTGGVLVQRKPEFGGVGDDDNGSGTGFSTLNGTVASVFAIGTSLSACGVPLLGLAGVASAIAGELRSLRSRAAWMAGCRPARTSWGVT